MDKKKKANQDKIKGMSRMQRSKDLETQWRGKQPSSGYDEQDDPAFDMAPDQNQEPDGDEQALPAEDPSVMYMGPENGPFECSNCQFFVGDGQPCQKVSDPVQSQGCCNQFQSAANEQEHAEGAQSQLQPSMEAGF